MAAATPFVKTVVPGQNALTGQAITFQACDATNGNTIVPTGTERIVVINIDAANPHTFTITGVVDPYGRTQNFSMAVPASTAFTAAAMSGIVSPVLAPQLWATGTPSLIGTPSSNNANLVVAVLQG